MIGLNLSFVEALKILKPLAIFVGGIAIYSVFIFKFYKFLAKREIFEINLDKYDLLCGINSAVSIVKLNHDA